MKLPFRRFALFHFLSITLIAISSSRAELSNSPGNLQNPINVTSFSPLESDSVQNQTPPAAKSSPQSTTAPLRSDRLPEGSLGQTRLRNPGLPGNIPGETGIRLVEIILLIGITIGIYLWYKKGFTFSYSQMQAASTPLNPEVSNYNGPFLGNKSGSSLDPADENVRIIAAVDPNFSADLFKSQIADLFLKIQAGWATKDLSGLSNYLTPEMASIFEREVGRLKAELRTNCVENISLRSIHIKRAWQEDQGICITANISAILVDYIRDDRTGEIVVGSDSEPTNFDEIWTFTRPLGSNLPWILTAIEPTQREQRHEYH